MRNKAVSLILACLVIICSVCGMSTAGINTVSEVQYLADGIISYKTGGQSVQDWISTYFPSNPDSVEWYALALSQNGDFDFSAYRTALEGYVESENIVSATARQKYALTLCALGSNSDYIRQTAENSIGQLGVMSYIYGLHLLNNNCTAGVSTEETVNTLLSMQLSDGGWAVIGDYGDVDVTAMALTALASARQYSGAEEAVQRGIEFLSQKQLDDGGFKTMGAENPESSCQVITALSALGIDCLSDPRFIKNDNTVFDAVCIFRLDDGTFCHALGTGTNETATVQAYYSFVAYLRMSRGQGSLFVFDHKSVQQEQEIIEVPEPVAEVKESTGERSEVSEIQEESVESEQESNGGNYEEQPEIAVTTAVTTVKAPAEPYSETSVSSACTSVSTAVSSAVTSVSSSLTVSETQLSESTASSSTTVLSATAETDGKKGGYKKTAVIAVILTGTAVGAVMFLLKKRNPKSYIPLIIVTSVSVAVILLTDIQSKEDYYKKPEKSSVTGTVTMTIRCDTVAEKAGIDPVILDVTEFPVEDGDTVFDVLTDACKTYGIQAENTGSAGNAHGMVYISGINNLYEFDWGELSGWMYFVNGEECSVGCGNYVLKDGDSIQWLYTCEIGNDLEQYGIHRDYSYLSEKT